MKANFTFRVSFCVLLMLACTLNIVAQSSSMKFTTVRGSTGATKNWTTDSVRVLLFDKHIQIVGYIPTGRPEPELKYQKMWISVKQFAGNLVYIEYGQLGDSFFDDIFSSGGKTKLVPTDYNYGGVSITKIDTDSLLVRGTFMFNFTSKPTVGDQFKTEIKEGEFVAYYADAITIEAKTSKTPVTARAGEKQKAVQILATNNAGLPIPGVKVFATNPFGKNVKEEIGITNDKGSFFYKFDIPDTTKSNDYDIKFEATKARYTDAKSVTKTVRVSSRYWAYKCGGLDLITFDAGEGKEFKKVNDVSSLLESSSTAILVNDILKIEGKLIIDPTAGQEQVRVEGDLVFENIPLPPTGAKGKFRLSTGSHTILPNCNNYLKYQIAQKANTKVGKYTISLDELSFTDNGVTPGVKVKGSINWDSDLEAKECSKSDNPGEKSLSLSMILTTEGIQEFGIGASNLVPKFIPHVCINDFGIKYNWQEDAFVINGFAQINKVSGTTKVKGALGTKNGKFDSLYVEYSGDCKPIPETPLCLDGGKFTLENWSSSTWKDQSVKVVAVLKSDEEVIKQKFPPVRALFDKVGLASWEIGGKWQFPRKFSVINTAKLFKDEYISKTKPWQVELSQGPCEIDLDKGLTYSYGAIKAGHFGADDYFITADAGTVKMTWSPSLSLELSSGGKIRLPNIPDAAPKGAMRTWLEAAKAQGYIPQDLGNGKIYLNLSETKGIKFEAYVDVSANTKPWINKLGKVHLTMSNATGSWHFEFGSGMKSISGSAWNGKGNHIQQNTPYNEVIQAVPLDTFVVGSNTERVIILIKSETAVPVAQVITPTGTRFDNTSTNPNISFVSGGPKYTMISLEKPMQGKWVLALDNPKATDSVSIIGSDEERPFTITASQAGKIITAKWDASQFTISDSVRIYIDNNKTGEDGIFVGSSVATKGEFSYMLHDSLAECTYYLYARPDVRGQFPDAVYANGEFTVNKTILAPPTNIVVESNQRGESLVRWNPSTASGVSFYIVSVKSTFGTDSTIAMVPKEELQVSVKVDTAQLKTLRVTSTNYDGLTGCPGIPQSITVGVDEEKGAWLSNANPVVVIPNPATTQATIHFALQQDALTKVFLVNTLGQVVTELTNGVLQQGLHSIQCSTSQLSDGLYYVRVVTPGQQFSTTMTVVR